MTCAPGHRGPAHHHVHHPVLVSDPATGSPAARMCECGEVFDLNGRAVESMAARSKARLRLEQQVKAALRAELERQGLEVPAELSEEGGEP